MSILTKVLGATVGIQYQGVKDQSETNQANNLGNAVFFGSFGRGRLDKPFAVTADNIAARLGYDPTNVDFMAVQDALDLGVPQVFVQRMRAGFNSTSPQPATIESQGSSENLDYFKAITAGTLEIVVNGTTHTLTGMTFAAATSLANVAALLQTKLNTAIGSSAVTVAYAASEFTIATVLTGSSASIVFNSGDILPLFGFEGLSATGGVAPIGTDYTLPETTIGMTSAGVVSLSATSATLTIVYSMRDIMDDGCSLEVSFSQRSGASTVTGLADIVGLMVWKDATTGEELYRLSGLMGARGTDLTLAQAAEDSEWFSSFVVTKVSSTDALVAASCLAGAAGNAANTLGRNKVTLTIPVVPCAATSIPTVFYTGVANTLITGELRPDYLAIARTNDLVLITNLLRVVDKLNIHLLGDIDPSLSIDSAITASNAIEAKDHRVSWFWNPTESRPRDAVSIRGARVYRPVVGVQIGYRLLRNAGTDSRGVPPIHVPVSGFNFPISKFKAMRPRADVVLNESALNRLAEAKINVVIQERLSSGTRFIFGDCLTQYDSKTSALRLTNSAEIETFTANGVIELIRRQLLTNTASFIDRADTDCRQFLDACVSAGLLVSADDLGGKPYELSISARESRPFDAVDVDFKRRPEGAVRAAYLTTTINK